MSGLSRNLLLLVSSTVLIAGASFVLGCDAGDQPHAEQGPTTNGKTPEPDWRCPNCNVLFVSIDTLRADHLGSYGYTRSTSPNIDRLASRSLVFSDVLAQSPTTAPSHRSMFSSSFVYQHRNRLRGLPVIAGLLSRAGYRTAGYVDGAQMRPEFGISKGFSSYDSTEGYHVDGAQIGGGLEAINPRAIEWLEKNGHERFFLFIHTYDVHCPYSPPEPYLSMFSEGRAPTFEIEGKCGARYFNRLNLTQRDFEYIAALYDGGIRYTDDKLQEILSALDRLGLTDETVVVITSDHGESLGERNHVGHNKVYDVQLKVPLIIALPSGRSQLIDAPAQSVDILPTLLTILGVDAPEGVSGIDLTDWLEGPRDENRVRLAQKANGSVATVNEGKRWALIIKWRQVNALYDLQADPRQENDVQHEHPDVVARLSQAFRDMRVPKEELKMRPEDLDPKIIEELKALGYTEE